MATVLVSDGSTATLKGVANGGTVLHGGNIASDGPITNAPGLSLLGAGSEGPTNLPHRSGTVYGRRRNGAEFALAESGTFCFNMTSDAVVGKRLSSTLGGNANTTLLSGGAGKGARARSAIHRLDTSRALGVNTWPYAPDPTDDVAIRGITKGGTAGDVTQFIDPATAGGAAAAADSAARPTRAIPGELVYHEGGATALQADYAAKTG